MSEDGPPGAPRNLLLGDRRVALGWCAVEGASASVLSAVELELAERGKTPKRRAEFIAGRVAARRAIAQVDPRLSGFDIVARDGTVDAGRPILSVDAGIAVSISHSSGWAVAAAAHGGPLGVDLESRSLDVGPAFVAEAFAPGELEGWAHFGTSALAVAWAAKEAMLKWSGVGLRAALQQVSVSPTQGGFTTNAPGVGEGRLQVIELSSLVLVLAG